MNITYVPGVDLYVLAYKGKQLVCKSMRDACDQIEAIYSIVHFDELEQLQAVKRFYN